MVQKNKNVFVSTPRSTDDATRLAMPNRNITHDVAPQSGAQEHSRESENLGRLPRSNNPRGAQRASRYALRPRSRLISNAGLQFQCSKLYKRRSHAHTPKITMNLKSSRSRGKPCTLLRTTLYNTKIARRATQRRHLAVSFAFPASIAYPARRDRKKNKRERERERGGKERERMGTFRQTTELRITDFRAS